MASLSKTLILWLESYYDVGTHCHNPSGDGHHAKVPHRHGEGEEDGGVDDDGRAAVHPVRRVPRHQHAQRLRQPRHLRIPQRELQPRVQRHLLQTGPNQIKVLYYAMHVFCYCIHVSPNIT